MSKSNFVTILSCVFVVLVATCSPVSAITWTENFESYAAGTDMTANGWNQATGPDLSGGALTVVDAGGGNMAVGAGAGESGGSRATGANPTDTDLIAELTIIKGSGHMVWGLGSECCDSANNRYRSGQDSVMMMFTPTWGIETYAENGGGYQAQSGLLSSSTQNGDELRFRLAAAGTTGVQSFTLSYDVNNSGGWTDIRTFDSGPNFSADYFYIGQGNGTQVHDNLFFQSLPEPTSATLFGIGLVMMLLNRRRRSR